MPAWSVDYNRVKIYDQRISDLRNAYASDGPEYVDSAQEPKDLLQLCKHSFQLRYF
jgi:hypothetical protein